MTLGMIEGVLLMGMVGLIWTMLNIFVGDHHAVDERHGDISPDQHHRMHQSMLPPPVLQKPDMMMVSLPATLIERLRNAVYWNGNPPLADLIAEAIEDIVTQMEEINEETMPQHVSPPKREVMTGRTLSSPLR